MGESTNPIIISVPYLLRPLGLTACIMENCQQTSQAKSEMFQTIGLAFERNGLRLARILMFMLQAQQRRRRRHYHQDSASVLVHQPYY